jgi:hypothetical protein
MVQPAAQVDRPIGAGFSLGTVKREGKGGDDLGRAREEDTRARGQTLVCNLVETHKTPSPTNTHSTQCTLSFIGVGWVW